jgi:hypothetical protein
METKNEEAERFDVVEINTIIRRKPLNSQLKLKVEASL